MNEQQLRRHCIGMHDLTPDSGLSGEYLKAWHDNDHTIVTDHDHPQELDAEPERMHLIDWLRNEATVEQVTARWISGDSEEDEQGATKEVRQILHIVAGLAVEDAIV